MQLKAKGDKMSLFTVTDIDKKVYEEQIKDFLPSRMIDIHTHIWRLSDYKSDPKVLENRRAVRWPSLVAPDCSVEDLIDTYKLMFPGKEVTPLMFAGGADDSNNLAYLTIRNNYVKESAKKTCYPALYFSTPQQGAEEIEKMIIEGGFLGLKSYLTFSESYLPEAEIRIFDFFPKHQLKVIDKLGGIIMLHIPRHGRLKDPVNIAQILEIKQQFPNIKLIIAHIGRAYTKEDVGNAFEELSKSDDILFDFCANTNEYVMTKMLESVGPKRVLFGSDLPILRMRMRRIEENGTYINLIPPGLYGDPRQDSHLREVSEEEGKKLTFFMYEEILAFKRACKNVGIDKLGVEDAFYNNGAAVIETAKKSIYK